MAGFQSNIWYNNHMHMHGNYDAYLYFRLKKKIISLYMLKHKSLNFRFDKLLIDKLYSDLRKIYMTRFMDLLKIFTFQRLSSFLHN